MSSLRWGIVGIGNIVNGTIAPAMVAEEHCEIVAGVSRDQGRADAFASQFGARYAYTDYDEMLANPEVDAVFIATPNSLHAEQVIAAAGAGKHVMCDKPMATNVDDARREVEACERAGVKFGINFHNRHLPWVTDTRRMISEGLIGEITLVEAEAGSGRRNWENWRADPEIAGLGTLYNVGVHVLDFLRYILGAEVVEVAAMFDRDPGSGSVESLDLVLIRFGSGTLGHMNSNEKVLLPQNNVAFHGTRGTILAENLTRSRVDGQLKVITDEGEAVTSYPSPGAHRLSVAAFTRAVLEDTEPNASGRDGLVSMLVTDAIARAVRTRSVVEVTY